jgi:beta-glucosidase
VLVQPLNGVYACENRLPAQRGPEKDWGFKGFVMSDWGATHSTVAAANNGLDQQSGHGNSTSRQYFGGALEEAVARRRTCRRRAWTTWLTRVVRAMFAKGVVDNPVAEGGAIDFAKNGAVSRADRGRGHRPAEERQ